MDFDSFIRYLAFLRWSRLLAYVFAFAGCFVIGYYFLVEHKNHRQTEWNFRNISHVHAGSLELDSGRIYEITWEQIPGKAIVPTEIIIDDEIYDTLNYFSLPYKAELRNYVKAYVNKSLQNPTRIRVLKPTKIGIIYRMYTDLYDPSVPGSFLGKWFESWFDLVGIINWSVRDITNSYANEQIHLDGNLYIRYNY